MNPVFSAQGTTVFERMSQLAREFDAINLGQGFPDGNGPADVIEAAVHALTHGSNQYPPMAGLPVLRAAVARHYAVHQALDLSPDDVIVTSGATEALAATIFALVCPGDEVVLFPPAYDAYLPLVERAGGIARFVRLEPPDWKITAEALATVGSARTKLVILNNPLNPTGSVASVEELQLVADFCTAHDAIAVADEVWEHVIFSGAAHQPLMALAGMRERTVKIGSAGKIFALTGWKVGWICASPPIAAVIAKAHQFLTFTTPPNLQSAVAFGLGKDMQYFRTLRHGFAASHAILARGLSDRGYTVLPSRATYFLSIDLAASGVDQSDTDFCDMLVRRHGVAAIPTSAFYPQNPVTNVVRFCFAKHQTTLNSALDRMPRSVM